MLQQINTYVATHDLNCGCDNPLKHIILQIAEQEPGLQFDKEEQNQIKKWLTTGEHGENPGGKDDDDGFGEGELERLFAEDDTEDTG